MRHYYFDLHNGTGLTRDEEGRGVADDQEAREVALENIRSILSDEARSGHLDLAGWIEVRNAGGETIMVISFDEAVLIHPGPGKRPA